MSFEPFRLNFRVEWKVAMRTSGSPGRGDAASRVPPRSAAAATSWTLRRGPQAVARMQPSLELITRDTEEIRRSNSNYTFRRVLRMSDLYSLAARKAISTPAEDLSAWAIRLGFSLSSDRLLDLDYTPNIRTENTTENGKSVFTLVPEVDPTQCTSNVNTFSLLKWNAAYIFSRLPSRTS